MVNCHSYTHLIMWETLYPTAIMSIGGAGKRGLPPVNADPVFCGVPDDVHDVPLHPLLH